MASGSDEGEPQSPPGDDLNALWQKILERFEEQKDHFIAGFHQSNRDIEGMLKGVTDMRKILSFEIRDPLLDFMTRQTEDITQHWENDIRRMDELAELRRAVEALRRHVDAGIQRNTEDLKQHIDCGTQRNTEDLKQHLDSRTAQGLLSSVSSINVNIRGSGAGQASNATGFPVNLIQDGGQPAAGSAGSRGSNNVGQASRPAEPRDGAQPGPSDGSRLSSNGAQQSSRRNARRQASPSGNSEDTPMTKEEINSRIAKLLRRDQKTLLVHLLRGFDAIDQSEIWNQATQHDGDTSDGRGHSEENELGDGLEDLDGGKDDEDSQGSKEGDDSDKDDDTDDSQDPKKGRRSRRDNDDEGGMDDGSGDGMGGLSNLFSHRNNNDDTRGQRRQSTPASPKSQPSPGPSGRGRGHVNDGFGGRHTAQESDNQFAEVDDPNEDELDLENDDGMADYDKERGEADKNQTEDSGQGMALEGADGRANDGNDDNDGAGQRVGDTNPEVQNGKIIHGTNIYKKYERIFGEAINALPPDPEPSRKQKKEMAASGLQNTAASQQTDAAHQGRVKTVISNASTGKKTPSTPKASVADASNGSDSGEPRRTGAGSGTERQPKRKNNELQDPPLPKKARTDAMSHGQQATSAARSTQNRPSPIQEADDEDEKIHVMPPLDHSNLPSFSPFAQSSARRNNSTTPQQPASSASQPKKEPQPPTATKTRDEPDRSKMPPPPVPTNTKPAVAMSNPVRQTTPSSTDPPSRKRVRDEADSDSEFESPSEDDGGSSTSSRKRKSKVQKKAKAKGHKWIP